MWSVFYDDFITFTRSIHEKSTFQSIDLLFRILGWSYARDGSKAGDFSSNFSAPGITIDLTLFSSGIVAFKNTERRTEELVGAISQFPEKGTMTKAEALKLRGRMQFADSQIFGRAGKLCLKTVSDYAYKAKTKNLTNEAKRALERFMDYLKEARPRQLTKATGATWYLYTDACYEPQWNNWPCGIGGVLVDPLGRICEFFSFGLSVNQIASLGGQEKKTIIFEAELLAVIAAFELWSPFFRNCQVVSFLDNNSARDVAISASARNQVANLLLEVLITCEMSAGISPWYARVPSPSNIADEPSRNEYAWLENCGAAQRPVDKIMNTLISGLHRLG